MNGTMNGAVGSRGRTRFWLALAVAALALWLLTRLAGTAVIGPLIAEWYGVLSVFYRWFGEPLRDLAYGLILPIMTAAVLVILGALSPCQISTSAAALAYLAPRSAHASTFARGAAAYVAGKVLTYSMLGVAVDWAPRLKLLALARLAYASLVDLLGDSTAPLLPTLLRWAHRPGRQANDAWRPRYRFRSALTALWNTHTPSFHGLP